MNHEHKRIVELAASWEDSDAVVSLSPGDAKLLESVGGKVKAGKRPSDPHTIVGKDLFAAAETIRTRFVETPEGAQPTPNAQSVTGSGTDPDPNKTTTPEGDESDEDLDALTVAELRDIATDEAVDLHGATKKDQIVAAIEKARAAK